MERGKLPVVCDTDRHCFEVAVRASGASPSTVRAVRIQNTLHVGECWVSEALLEELRNQPHITVVEEGLSLTTDTDVLTEFSASGTQKVSIFDANGEPGEKGGEEE